MKAINIELNLVQSNITTPIISVVSTMSCKYYSYFIHHPLMHAPHMSVFSLQPLQQTKFIQPKTLYAYQHMVAETPQ
jgi:hypothetical protein